MEAIDGCGVDVCGLKYICHEHKFIFFEVPKNGSASLLEVLNTKTTVERMADRYGFLEYPEYLKFAFVRNPWDRSVSCYLNKIKKDDSFENENFEKGVMRKFKRFRVFYAGMSFKEFLREVSIIPDEIADGHFASQYRRLIMDGEIIMDEIFRFENYESEVNRLLTLVGLEEQTGFPRINQNRGRSRYPEYYDDEMQEIVGSRYQEDIAYFNYQFDS